MRRLEVPECDSDEREPHDHRDPEHRSGIRQARDHGRKAGEARDDAECGNPTRQRAPDPRRYTDQDHPNTADDLVAVETQEKVA